MSGTSGENLKVTLFGESHGEAVGVVLTGLPCGIDIDMDRIAQHMARRAPGKSDVSTPRKEPDKAEIQSGLYNGKTTSAPLCAIIRNTSQRSSDYDAYTMKPRPGHADYTAYIKYNGMNDPRGGGHFSGRLTAPLTFAGAVCMQALEKVGVHIGAHAAEIAGIQDTAYDPVNVNAEILDSLKDKELPTLSDEAGGKMRSAILQASQEGDSVGGVIECACTGLPVGLGEPFFSSVESVLSALLFSIPGVKGVEFGAGFGIARMQGSKSNDPFFLDGGMVKTRTNNCGGTLGGISDGMPIVFRTAVKPTPSIRKKQETIDFDKMETTEIEIHGRHDPCIVPRAVPVVESAAAIALLDLMITAALR